MLLPTLSLLLGHRPPMAPPAIIAFGIYSNLSAMTPATRYGVLVIARRALDDGSTVTDVATFPAAPAANRTMSTYILSRGRIVRDIDGSTVSMDLRATNGGGVVGSSHWERVKEEKKKNETGTDGEDETKPALLKGEMNCVQVGHRSAILPEDAFYSLGTVEALTSNPRLTAWCVPSVGGMLRVFTASLLTNTATQYHLGSGAEGIFWFANQAMRLRVCPITFDGPPDRMTVGEQPVSTNVRALALYDMSGRLVGFGSRFGISEDIESVEAGGHTGEIAPMRPSYSKAPNPFPSELCPAIMSCLAREDLSPGDAAEYLRAMT